MGVGGGGRYIDNTTTNLHGLESCAPLLQQLLGSRHPLRLVLRVPDSQQTPTTLLDLVQHV